MSDPSSKVVIDIAGGVIQHIECPPDVEVIINDYDEENE